jgi:hypothetical protein
MRSPGGPGFIGTPAVVSPAEKPSGGILDNGITGFVRGYRDIGVSNEGGGEENRRTRRKLYHQLKVPKDEVTSLVRIEVTTSSVGTPAVGSVPCI